MWLLMMIPFFKAGSQKVYTNFDIDLSTNISTFTYKELSVSAKIFISCIPSNVNT